MKEENIEYLGTDSVSLEFYHKNVWSSGRANNAVKEY